MKLCKALFECVVEKFELAGVGRVGVASAEFAQWLDTLAAVPSEFIEFLKRHSPKTELWAGAGFLYDESRIIDRNSRYPEFLRDGLFIFGSAPNGDHIVVDLRQTPGAVGYVAHEEVRPERPPRSVFVPVCDSIGEFIWRINKEEPDLPIDYYEARERQRRS